MEQSSGRSPMPVAQPREPLARVLVADRDATLAQTLRAILRHDGFSVEVVSTAAAASRALRTSSYDIVLVDLNAEDATGAEVLAQARALPLPPTVIVLSGYASLESSLRALRAGAYDYLAKPIDVEELRLTLSRALERRSLERELAARVEELERAHDAVQGFNARLRQQVEAATAELTAKVHELDETNRQLAEAQARHERFVAMVAHEMRGPLNPIINYAQLARRPNLAPEAIDRYMESVIEHAFRLNRLVDDLQTATRLSTGQFSLRRAPCDVAAAVAEVVEQFRTSMRDREVRFERPDAPVMAEVDHDRVVQAVRNLIDNAAKYSAEGGAIEVAVWQESERALVRVGDYGAGIPVAEMRRIFDAFTRLGERTSSVAGSGLGLYITRGIVAAHEGKLTVVNRSGDERANGAIFTIALPLRAAPTAP